MFSYSKSEFRGILVLVILMAVLLYVRIRQYCKLEKPELVISERVPAEKIIQNADPDDRLLRISEHRRSSQSATILPLDPNTANYEELKAAGLSSRAAGNLIRYREAGGSVSRLSDMQRIYGLDSALVASLAHNFSFGEEFNDQVEEKKEDSPLTLCIELNRAEPAELARLPGIGEVLSFRITRYRDLLGGYYSADQLSEVYGIDDSLKNSLIKYLSVDTMLINKTDLNQTSLEVLKKHPYIKSFQARSIMEYRRLQGLFNSTKSLINNNIFTYEEYEKIKHYLVASSE